ncbi:MAG: translational GTPase TypA [Endozoicomonadaceae bacterium]|nr:translational GTPase TypA [Endozoicomonadaceae bacterium]MBE8232654.1 translational GTPase TypA [Endozoicomonadaceae bacterium]
MTTSNPNKLRNVAIIAHVDHGKTTLVDKLLQQSGILKRKNENSERILDFNDQEKERGITILAKNTAVTWDDYTINIVDTPGHADFSGEVERIMSMVDSVLLIVDAVDGPMPQTRFVTQLAFQNNLNPIVVINKIDREEARPDWVVNEIFDLFCNLSATEKQLDFPIIYASAIEGTSGLDLKDIAPNMNPLFETIIQHVPAPAVDLEGAFQMQISALDYNSYVGIIGIGRIKRGTLTSNTMIQLISKTGERRNGRILQVMRYLGLERIPVESAHAGEIVCITGIDNLNISDTLCDPAKIEALPPLSVDEPTVSMTIQVNDSPFCGQEGRYLTSRNLKDRLEKELLHNVALRVEQGSDPDKFIVSGRGELHLSVLIESMRREKFEMGVSRPEVIFKEEDGIKKEPYERVLIDLEERHQGSIMEEMGIRKAELLNMNPDGKGRTQLEFLAPARGLLGFRSLFLTLTSGSGVLTHIFDHYGPVKSGVFNKRKNGVLISMVKGKSLGYALFNLQDRGRLFIKPAIPVYEGMIIGEHSRANDLVVNPTKAKQLTNIRASGTDEHITLVPPIEHSLEQAIEFIDDDELVEVTPSNIRLRKKKLTENERKRANKN